MREDATTILKVEGVTRTYRLPRTSTFSRVRQTIDAVKDVSLEIKEGETVGLVGESGSGKSTLTRLITALERPDSGAISFRGEDMHSLGSAGRRQLRRQIQIVFQDPMSSLDPRMRVGDIVKEPLRSLKIDGDHGARVREVIDAVGLPTGADRRYPHEFSGGQRQRIAIARALAPHPRFLVADEPVSALDLSIQAQILNLLNDLKAEFDLTILLVAHDLNVVNYMADRVAVMYLGSLVELGEVGAVYGNALHPYTELLLGSSLALEAGLPDIAARGELVQSGGEGGCVFRQRCPERFERCDVETPVLGDRFPQQGPAVRLEHSAACFLD